MNWSWLKAFKKIDKKVRDKYKKETRFPCSDDHCLVRMACTQACEKLERDDDELKELFLKYNACPDCGSETFSEGPSGGMSQNVKCNGCGHWFNLGLPLFIQRIHIGEDGKFY